MDCREEWNLQRCNPLSTVAFTVSRLVWSLQQQSIDAGEGGNKLLDSITSSMDGGGNDGPVYE